MGLEWVGDRRGGQFQPPGGGSLLENDVHILKAELRLGDSYTVIPWLQPSLDLC